MAEEGEVGLLAEVSLKLDLEDCILSLVINECPRENSRILVSRILADIGGAGIENINFLLATINTNILKKS
jgi:hypothetical protein